MPINLFGSQYEAPDTFAYTDNNPSLNWMNKEYFYNSIGAKPDKYFTEYWKARDVFWATKLANFSNLKDFQGPNKFNYVKNYDVSNIWRNRQAWFDLDNILKNGGNILALDTETIGDFINEATNYLDEAGVAHNRAIDVAGITEIAFTIKHHKGYVSKNFSRAHQIADPQGSFFFGIDSEQKQWLEDVLQKKIKGETLTSTEASAMERASRHSTLGPNGFRTVEREWNNKTFTFIEQLNVSKPDSVEDIKSGIEAMAAHYNTDRDDQIKGLIEYLNDFTTKKNSVIVGQNLSFDVKTLNRYANKHNLTKLQENLQYADTYHAAKAYAQQNNIAASEIVKQVNPSVTNPRLNSLEAVTEAMLNGTTYAEGQAHIAYEDNLAVLRFIENIGNDIETNNYSRATHFNITDKALDVIHNVQSNPNTLKLEDSYIKINAKGNIRHQDLLVVSDKVTNGHQVSNEYWTFTGFGQSDYTGFSIEDVNKQTKTIKDTANQYIVKLQSVHHKDMTLYKAFANEEDAQRYFEKYTTLVNKSEANLGLQAAVHDRDVARRVIDGFFEHGQVTKDDGGFTSFKKYYKAYQDLASLSDDAVSSMNVFDVNGNKINTSRVLLKNINAENNAENIIKYARENDLTNVVNVFSTTKRSTKLSHHDLAIEAYDIPLKMEHAFDIFEKNKDFFEYSYKNLEPLNNSLSQTIAFNELKKLYIESNSVTRTTPSKWNSYSIHDLFSVSIDKGNGSSARIDISENSNGATQLLRAFTDKNLTGKQNSARLIKVAENLRERDLLSKEAFKTIQDNYGAVENPFHTADAIVSHLRADLSDVTDLGNDTVGFIQESLEEKVFNRQELAEAYNIDESLINKLINKDNKRFIESATSEMSNVSGNSLSKELVSSFNNVIEHLSGTTLISGSFDNDFSRISNTLSGMGYNEQAISEFGMIYYSNAKSTWKSAIKNFNEGLEPSKQIRPLFYRSQGEEASAFAIFTTDKYYSKTVDTLSNLKPNATNRQVKDALTGMASYFEIPYLKQFDLGEDADIKALSSYIDKNGVLHEGHGARAVFVKQGDDFYRYDTFSFNVYEKDDVLRGGIKDQGSSFVTSIRQRADEAYAATSEENFGLANAKFNNPNISRMTEEASPQISGTYNLRGELARMHSVSTKDVSYAHAIAIDPGEGNIGIRDIMRLLTTDKAYTAASSESSLQAENAIRGIYKAFAEQYDLHNNYDTKNLYLKNPLEKVYNSEPFKGFYQKHLTIQTGGIGADSNVIQNILNNKYKSLDPIEVDAIRALRDKSLLQIMAQASESNGYVSDEVAYGLDVIANRVHLNAVYSESFAHNTTMLVNYAPAMMNNSRSSLQMRPTYSQRDNYRSYRLDEMFFDNPQELENNLGIHFGDLYTSKQYFDSIESMDKQVISAAGEQFNARTASRRNIIGAVQSISDAEIRHGKDEALVFLQNKFGNLNQKALSELYDRMAKDINTYEGKAYMRPSLANQDFFALGDPKTVKSPQVRSIFELGSEPEIRETSGILSGLVGNKVENGTVIGRRLVKSKNGSKHWQDIIYNGQTIHKFTEQNAEELANMGKTLAVMERQLEGFKGMFGEEKATIETLSYYTSLDPAKREKEIIDLMTTIGLENQGSLKKNVALMNQYSDAVFDAFTRTNDTRLKTVLIGNNNIIKHLSDTAIDSRWNIIRSVFKSEEDINTLYSFMDGSFDGRSGAIKFKDGSTLMSHLSYNPVQDALMFDNPLDNGATNVLDELTDRLRLSKDSKAQEAINIIDSFEKNNIAMQSIQRQQMNTFQGQAFKIDQRFYQALSMQDRTNIREIIDGKITYKIKYDKKAERYGAELAELIRENIQSGEYDKNIAGLIYNKKDYKQINKVWADIVRNRRGKLSPKDEMNMFTGLLESFDYVHGALDVSKKNMINVNAKDLLSNIPKGGGAESYANFIFKVNSEPTDYIKALAIQNNNNVQLAFNSNSFYLDLSDYGKFEFKGNKNLTGIVLPFHYVRTDSEEMFLGESTKKTMRFFRKLQDLKPNTDNSKAIQDALNDLFDAYDDELSTGNKDSLVTKAFYKMKMPNSSGALAKDAIVPTLELPVSEIRELRETTYNLTHALDMNQAINPDDWDKYLKLNKNRYDLLNATKMSIKNAEITDDVVSLLNITSNNRLYEQYLRHFDKNGKLVGNVIENAIVVGEDILRGTEMDPGNIGMEILRDYFSSQKRGLKNYDALSRTEKQISDFIISNSEFEKIFEEKFFQTFDGTEHKEWMNKTRDAMHKLLDPNIKMQNGERHIKATNIFFKRLEDYLKSDNFKVSSSLESLDDTVVKSLNRKLSEESKRKFLLDVQSIFDDLGKRYAKEVGILGMVGRYPFFNETGILPVRIYFDETIKGKEIRFLGPQFSVFQNLDFDGDNEFIKFLANGGLLAKNSEEAIRLNAQFDKMNSFNLNVFANSLKDSIKEYRYGDEAYFKASLLKDLKSTEYNRAASKFLGAMPKDMLDVLEKDEYSDIKELLIAHSSSMRKAYKAFDEVLGSSIHNPDMIKAAIQARFAKEYIGNYSKPNLEIRNAMQYMQSLAEDRSDELTKLRQIREMLYTFNDEPGGLLTILEQKGIDTKHVHDAEKLTNSSAWRVGVTKLFANANGAENIDIKKRLSALDSLVEGSRRIFFTSDAFNEMSNNQISQHILSKTFDEWNALVGDAIKEGKTVSDADLGSAYISALYEMSQMKNAYQGYQGVFRHGMPDIAPSLLDMTPEKLEQFMQGSDLDLPTKKMLLEAYKTRTDDKFLMFGRSIRQGDILTYQTDTGFEGIIFEGFRETGEKNRVPRPFGFSYDFATGEIDKQTIYLGQRKGQPAITIRELNENIKTNHKRRLLDVTNPNTPEHNLNIRDLSLSKDSRLAISRRIAAVSTEDNLQWLFDNFESNKFKSEFNRMIKQNQIIPGYGGINKKLGTVMSDIAGNDADALQRRIRDLHERIQYGIEHGNINTKATNAKELIRSINKDIARHPRKSVITGDNALDTVVQYLEGSGATIGNRDFLTRSVQDIELSNAISQEINDFINIRDTNINKIAEDFYNSTIQKQTSITNAFTSAKEAWQKEVKESTKKIFDSIKKASNPQEEMLHKFGWNAFTRDNNFKIKLGDATIDSNVRIGYGQFTGARVRDLVSVQQQLVNNEIDEALKILPRDSIEYLAASNTKEILSHMKNVSPGTVLNFKNEETLLTSYKAIFNPEAATAFGEQAGEELLGQAKENAIESARQATSKTKRKTLASGIGESIQSLSPDARQTIKIGGMVLGGTALLGLAGHALFNSKDSKNVEMPKSVENEVKNINNKNGLEYDNEPTDAKLVKKQTKAPKIAPPSILQNKTIYHDSHSGFNFKVSAQSYDKLHSKSYQNIMNTVGLNGGQVNITRDNSKITDNWLENKFAQLME